MRISSSYFFQTGLNSINAQQSDLLHLYQQTASGKRMVTPADDPLGAAQAINLRQSQSLNERYAANRDTLNLNLGQEEDVLRSATQLLQDIKTTLIEAGNGTRSDLDRQTLASVLEKAKENMLGLANSTDGNGEYIFSGHSSLRTPFIQDANGVVSYAGDSGQRLIQADQTRRIAGNDIGSDVFAGAESGSRAYITEAGSNTGTGLIGSPSIIDPAGAHVGRSFTVEFSGSPVQYTIDVLDADGNPVLDGLGNPVVEGPHLYDSGTKALQLPGGVQVSFSGQPADGDTFSVKPAADASFDDLSVFSTLDSIIAALKIPTEGNPAGQATQANALASAMQKIDINHDQVVTVRASIGARMNEVDAISNTGDARGLSYANELIRLEDVDYYRVSTQLQLRTAALEAASMAFKQIQGLSLFTMGSR